MPKAAPINACQTCLKRKVRCDGALPTCARCAVGNRDCVRRSKEKRFQFVAYNSPGSIGLGDHVSTQVASPTLPSAPQARPAHLRSLASLKPSEALQDAELASLFAHYIANLAPWYDLNDPQRTFGTTVPETALQTSILFKAIIAFSACHWSKVHGSNTEIATVFHEACISDFLRSMQHPDSSLHGSHLAATCLLRSYELISDGSEVESHLLGAYSYAANKSIDFSDYGIIQVGAWNYLREEITIALIQRRDVRMGHIFDTLDLSDTNPQHGLQFNLIGYILGRIINFCFAEDSAQLSSRDRRNLWQSLCSELLAWKEELPPSFQAFSAATKVESPFPAMWMLRPWHVAAQQYYTVARMMLTLYDPAPAGGHISRRSLDVANEQALQVCGMALTSKDDASRVNAFGPLAFCGRYLDSIPQQTALVELLREMSAPTGFPVAGIIRDLEAHWASEY